MMEKIKYINHLSEEIEWGKGGIYVNYNDLRDFSWSFSSDNNKISSFHKGIVKKKVPLLIYCDSVEEGIFKKNQLFEICEKDVLAEKHGRIIIGDYYLECYVTASKKTEYLANERYMKATLEISTDLPSWVSEKTFEFSKRTEETAGTGKRNFDFNYDFNYDFKCSNQIDSFINENFIASDFRIVFRGKCLNPSVTIAGHNYKVNAVVDEGCTLTVDSVKKEIYLTDSEGNIKNCFHLRNRSSYIFQKIPAGKCVVAHHEELNFEITVIEGRSEPKWI